MSNKEEDFKNKNKILDNDEEEEGEEENDEEIDEESNSNENNNKDKKSLNNTIKISDNNNDNDKTSNNKKEEKNENSEMKGELKINLKNNNISNNNNNNTNIKNDLKIKAEYIALIEGLENELKLEKNINIKLKDNFNSDEIIKLKNDLKEKDALLEKLISTHKKQKSALSLLTKQLDKENKKRLKIYLQEKNQTIHNNDDTDRSINKLSKEQAVNIVLKVKDKELSNATNKMNALKSENETLKKILYENEDYNNNINLEDKTKEINDKIEKCNNEKNILLKQLKIHKKCIEEQKEYNDKYDNLKEELKDIKKNVQKVRNDTLKLINNQKNISLSNNLYLGLNSQSSIQTNKRYNNAANSSPNIHLNKNKNKNQKNNIIILPLITSQTNSQNESILTDNFTKKIKEYLNNDEEEYITLINKISNLENSRKIIETKHKSELNQFNSQISSLNEQFKVLNCDSKGSNCNIRVLKYKLNTIKGDNKQQSKKLNELKKEYQSKINISKEKDYEISLLIGQINSLRNLANYSNIEIPEDDINNYIEKLKKEKRYEINKKVKEEKKNDKNENNKNVSKMEESIQADFSESEDYNEEEEYEKEEEEKILKNNKKVRGKI